MTTKAVLFDMDGVLTDSEPVINAAAIQGLREYGVQAEPEDFLPFVGAGEDRYIGGVAARYNVEYKPEMKDRVYQIYLQMLPGMLHLYPGVHELLQKLRQAGFKLGLATSADRIKMEANLDAIEIPREWFAAVVVGEDVERKKPDPQIYLKCADALHVPPERCWVVEDAINGVQAAKAAGMRCLALTTSFPASELQAQSNPDCIRSTIQDISVSDFVEDIPVETD